MKFLKELMLDRSYFDRVPDQSLVMDNGEKYNRILATRGKNYAMFYIYNGRACTVAMGKLGFEPAKATWLNPADNRMIPIKSFNKENTFTPPGEKRDGNDWVLILEK